MSRPLSREQLLAILSLGLLRPVPAVLDAAAAAVAGAGPERVARLLFRHKVANIAIGRLARLGTPEAADAAARLAEIRASFNARYATAPQVLDVLRRGAKDRGVLVRPMKGMAVEAWYPDGVRRDVGDLDLWVATSAEGWDLAAVLREHGYEYAPEELPWFKTAVDGRRYGQMRLVEPDRRTVSVDVHVGPYSVRYCGVLGLGGEDVGPWQPLSDEDLFCAAVANAAGDCDLDAKTVNDLVLGLDRDLDVDRIARSLAEPRLLGFLASALDEVAATSVVDGAARARLDELRARAGDDVEPVALVETVDATARARLVSEHTRAAAGGQHGFDDDDAESLAGAALDAYLRASEPSLVDGGGRAGVPTANPWTCVRLVPLATAAALSAEAVGATSWAPATGTAADLAVVALPEGDLVRAGGDLFVPTVDFRMAAHLVRAASGAELGAAG